MKQITLSLLAVLFSSTGVFAQEYIRCSLRIPDNKVDCPFLGGCPHKVLKESTAQFLHEISPGEKKQFNIPLRKVILFPNTEAEKKNRVLLFKLDSRDKAIQNDVEMISYPSPLKIGLTIEHKGDRVELDFESDIQRLNLYFQGQGSQKNLYLLTSETAISLTCSLQNNKSFNEARLRKEAIKKHEEKKASKNSAGAKKQ